MPQRLSPAPLVFVNIGWMTKYAGPSADDPTLGGHGHLKSHRHGHEAWNFKPHRGTAFGYIPRSSRIAIERLGAARKADEAVGVTVVWVARSPRDRITYIVGWYRNATVYRKSNTVTLRRSSGFDVDYQVKAAGADMRLLSVDARLFRIPTAKQPGNLGQSPVWYGKDDKFRKSVLAYVEAGGVFPATTAGGKRHQPDPDLRRRIEEAAVEHATLYYESAEGGKRSVVSVERNARGWDLESSGFDGSMLKVEVKGLQGRQVVAELTPNEYTKMLDPAHRRDYVIYIVTGALEKVPKSHVFRYDAERSKSKSVVWVTDDDRKLVIEPLVGARVSC